MTDRRPRAMVYAEDMLGVIRLYEEAQAQLGYLEAREKDLRTYKNEVTLRKQELAGHEVNLMEQARLELIQLVSNEGKVSEAAIERTFKRLRLHDDKWQDLHGKLESAMKSVDVHTDLVQQMELKIRTTHNQMKVVASYLEFLAAHRTASTEALRHGNLPY